MYVMLITERMQVSWHIRGKKFVCLRGPGYSSRTVTWFYLVYFGCIPFDQSKSGFCDPKFDFLLVLICHQPTYSCHAVLPEKMFQYAYRSCLQDWLSQFLLLTHLQSCLVFTGMLVVRRTCDVSCSQLACEWQTFLLAHRRWGTFREQERLRLSDRNSILMT